MSTFWDGFWPNLASTLIGVIVGVPVALWLNSIVCRRAERNKKKEERKILRSCLQVISNGLQTNQLKLSEIAGFISSNRSPWNSDLDMASWDTTKNQISILMLPPELHHKIAKHFDRIGALNHLHRMYLDFCIGIQGSMSSAPQTRDSLKAYIIHTIAELTLEGTSLQQELKPYLQ